MAAPPAHARAARYAQALVAAALLLAASPPALSAREAGEEAARRAAGFLLERQQASGAFFGPDQPADLAAETLAAVVVGGARGEPVRRTLGYLRRHGPERARERAAFAGRIVVGLVAAGANPRRFDGTDYVALTQAGYNAATGAYDQGLYANAVAALGIVAAGERLPERAVAYLRANQCPDGGFGHREGCAGGSDIDTTALTLAVVAGTGISPSDSLRARARSFLAGARNDGGGFGHRPGEPTNANSAGLSLSAIVALGEDPRDPPWHDGRGDPLAALLELEHPGGGFRYLANDPEPNDYATVQALPGAAGEPLPPRPRPGAASAPGSADSDQPGGERSDDERRPAGTDDGGDTGASPPARSARPPDGSASGLLASPEDGHPRGNDGSDPASQAETGSPAPDEDVTDLLRYPAAGPAGSPPLAATASAAILLAASTRLLWVHRRRSRRV